MIRTASELQERTETVEAVVFPVGPPPVPDARAAQIRRTYDRQAHLARQAKRPPGDDTDNSRWPTGPQVAITCNACDLVVRVDGTCGCS